jgi:hypothetical protein
VRVLACGGRDFLNYDTIVRGLSWLGPSTILAHGGASGADTLAGRFGKSRGWEVVVFPADWTKYGNAAGPIRNQQMLEVFLPELVIAFPGGRGTNHMVGIAQEVGVLTERIVLL